MFEPRMKQAKLIAELLRAEHHIFGPCINIKKFALIFSKLYYYHSEQNPDFNNTAGFSVYEDGQHKIYINADLPEGRDAFTVGHETGHIVMGHHRIIKRTILCSRDYYKLDREANVFAANILMPEKWVRQFAEPPIDAGSIWEMKNAFGVSWAAIINRLDELGIQEKSISLSTFKSTATG